jgi:uncharacterized protein (TIGR02996 family)
MLSILPAVFLHFGTQKSMNTEQKGLLRAIRKNPEDRTARLVYADWLDEHDDPLAGYVRAECAVMAATPGGKTWKGALDRMLAAVKKAKTNLGGWEYAKEVTRLRGLLDPDPEVESMTPVVPESALIAYEKRNGVTLPGEYRAVLLQVGNGWTDGSENGIFRFDPKRKDKSLAAPFALTRADALEMLNELRHTFTSEGRKRPEWAKRRDYNFDGCKTIADFGCGNAAYLIVSGELRGHVWSYGDVNGPWSDEKFSRLFGYFDWFEPVYKAAMW